MIHHCHGCCGDREDAINKVHNLLSNLIVGRSLTEPALNKWTSVTKCATALALPLLFHRILSKAENAAFGPACSRDKAPLRLDDDEDVLAVSMAEVRRTRQKYSRRAGVWLQTVATPATFVAFLTLAMPLTKLHHRLFKHGMSVRIPGKIQ